MWANMIVEYCGEIRLLLPGPELSGKKKKSDTTLIKYQSVSVQRLKIEPPAPLLLLN